MTTPRKDKTRKTRERSPSGERATQYAGTQRSTAVFCFFFPRRRLIFFGKENHPDDDDGVVVLLFFVVSGENE